jgi:hypothetical protein
MMMMMMMMMIYIQNVPGGKVTILGGYSIGHSQQKSVYACVLFRTVSEIEAFHCTVPKLLIRKRYYVLYLILIFTVQVTKLVPRIIHFQKFHCQHQCTLQLVGTWPTACQHSALYSETAYLGNSSE